jgi:hypothetical protein
MVTTKPNLYPLQTQVYTHYKSKSIPITDIAEKSTFLAETPNLNLTLT